MEFVGLWEFRGFVIARRVFYAEAISGYAYGDCFAALAMTFYKSPEFRLNRICFSDTVVFENLTLFLLQTGRKSGMVNEIIACGIN